MSDPPKASGDLAPLPHSLSLMPAEVARIALSCSAGQLWEHVSGGRLDAVVLSGTPWLLDRQVMALGADLLAERAHAGAAQLGPVTDALRSFLRRRPLVTRFSEATTHLAPLLAARRGAVHVRGGIEFHSVAVAVAALSGYIADALDADDIAGGVPGGPRAAGWAALPVGGALARLLASLDGVTETHNVTAYAEPGRPRRVYRWIRVDPTAWPPTVPPGLAAEIDSPGARGGR